MEDFLYTSSIVTSPFIGAVIGLIIYGGVEKLIKRIVRSWKS